MDDLSTLEEVYTDNLEPVKTETLSDTRPESPKPADEVNVVMNVEDSSSPVKTIIIDTKKGSKVINDNNNLEISPDYSEDNEDTEDESSNIKQKVYNKYSRKRDFSFFD